MSAGVGGYFRGCPWMFLWVNPRVRVSASVDVSGGMPTDVCGCFRRLFRGRSMVAAAGRGCFRRIVVGIAMGIAVACVIASDIRPQGIPLLAAAFHGNPWNVRGSKRKVRGSFVEYPRFSAERRGGSWTLSRSSTKKSKNVLPHTKPTVCCSAEDGRSRFSSTVFAF